MTSEGCFFLTCATKVGDPLDLFRSVDVGPWARLDAADVDDVCALGDRAVDRGQRGVGRKRRALVEE